MYHRDLPLWFFSIMWVLNSNTAVWADDPQAKQPSSAYRMKEVTVTAEESHPAAFLPDTEGTKVYAGKKTAVINLQEVPPIINNNYRQALAQTPGLLLSEETTPLISIGYRGLAPARAQFMQVLKDGIPIHADMFGYPESYYTPPFQSVDHIEFIHGGAGLMYGPQPGGVINFVTRDPDPKTPFAAYTENSWGSDELFSTYTSLSGSMNPLGYAGYFHERQGNGFRVTNSDFEVLGGGLKITLGQNDDSRWKLAYDEYHEEHGEPGGLTKTVADSEGRDVTTRFNDRFRLERYYASLTYEQDLGEQAQLDVKTFGGHYRRYSKRQDGGGFGTLPTGTTNAIEEQDFYTYGLEPRFRYTYDALGQEGHVLTAGMLAYFSDSPREDQRGANPAADTGALRIKSDRSMQYLSLFAEHLFRFGALSITPGARLEHIWQHAQEQLNVTKTSVPLGDSQEFDFVPLFGIGAQYAAHPLATVYSNISQSYRPKLFAQSVPTGATQTVNNDLEEGKSWTLDFGVRGTQGGYFHYDASYFLLRFDNQIGTAGSTVDNVGDTRHQGLEFAVDVDAVGLIDALQGSKLKDELGSFSPYLNLMLLDAKFIKGPQNGKTPQYAPQYTLRFGAQYDFRDLLKVNLGSTFLDDHFADDANTANQTIPSYKVWDLSTEVHLWKEYLTLFGGINNLFDERYYARVTSGGIDPAAERNIYGGVRASIRF